MNKQYYVIQEYVDLESNYGLNDGDVKDLESGEVNSVADIIRLLEDFNNRHPGCLMPDGVDILVTSQDDKYGLLINSICKK